MRTLRSTATEVARWTPLVRIRGRSMQPTLAPGRLLLTRPPLGRVAVGDIVVITAAPGTRYVKRVAAGPGDLVELEAGRLYVNDRPWDGQPRVAGARVQSWRVPEGHWFVVGDDLQASDDSRVWPRPFVAASRISGVALGRWRRPGLAASASAATRGPARCRSRAAP
ncbi:signal peptidase I [Ramlibacter tataouinensis]|uniref:signal peptidase I n=1 Tax=Ramlibacter tataouinensis TaxID=94132 RepID=UPI0022F3F134|nr:signal peptidase I [Ramlibacter tataouinensis]WBY01369.1 signal peptidase I [Ramlibacter tataouinensis]